MTPQVLILLIPVLALATGLVAVLRMPRKAFLAEPKSKSNPNLEARVEALEQELGAVRQDLAETLERLDFTERMLARGDEGKRLAQGGGGPG